MTIITHIGFIHTIMAMELSSSFHFEDFEKYLKKKKKKKIATGGLEPPTLSIRTATNCPLFHIAKYKKGFSYRP